MVLVALDNLLYMHMTAYTLIHIDHINELPVVEKYSETTYDDLIMQIVETSYAYGFEAFAIEKQNWSIAALIRKQGLTRQDLEQYCAVLAAILSEERFSVLLYNGIQVQYMIIYNQRCAEIYKYAVRNEIRGDEEEKLAQTEKQKFPHFRKLWNIIQKGKNR